MIINEFRNWMGIMNEQKPSNGNGEIISRILSTTEGDAGAGSESVGASGGSSTVV